MLFDESFRLLVALVHDDGVLFLVPASPSFSSFSSLLDNVIPGNCRAIPQLFILCFQLVTALLHKDWFCLRFHCGSHQVFDDMLMPPPEFSSAKQTSRSALSAVWLSTLARSRSTVSLYYGFPVGINAIVLLCRYFRLMSFLMSVGSLVRLLESVSGDSVGLDVGGHCVLCSSNHFRSPAAVCSS